MGLFANIAKRRMKGGKGTFEPLELTEDNVQTIFIRCGKPSGARERVLDMEALRTNRANIYCLLGQLALVHQGVDEHEIDSAFFKTYDGRLWTDSMDSVVHLLNMGWSINICSFFEKDDKLFVHLEKGVYRALSPKDPGFTAWWESADNLALQILSTNDTKEAFLYCKKAAEQGHAKAQYLCGNHYKYTGAAADKAKALYWYEKAAEQGHAKAQLNCGLMYYKGEGTPEDKVKALYWCEKAAEQGHVDAQFNCSVMYYHGEGTPEDKAKALYWYEKAAEQGHVDAQFACGVMYCDGVGTPADKVKALYWYEKAAEQGHQSAQLNCGLMYDKGEGTAANKTKAKMWFQKAAAQTKDKKVQENAKFFLRDL